MQMCCAHVSTQVNLELYIHVNVIDKLNYSNCIVV